jgi:hypothetical protein
LGLAIIDRLLKPGRDCSEIFLFSFSHFRLVIGCDIAIVAYGSNFDNTQRYGDYDPSDFFTPGEFGCPYGHDNRRHAKDCYGISRLR